MDYARAVSLKMSESHGTYVSFFDIACDRNSNETMIPGKHNNNNIP